MNEYAFMKVANWEQERVAFQLDEWNIKCEFLMLTLTSLGLIQRLMHAHKER